MLSASSLRLSHTVLHRGFAWVCGVLLVLAMFALSYPDCSRAAEDSASLSGAGTLARTASLAATLDHAVRPALRTDAASCPTPDVAVAGASVSDLPDFDLAPVHRHPPSPHARHAWVPAPAVDDRTAMAWLTLRPPDA